MEQLYIAEKPAVAAALADFFSRHGNKFTKENGHFISIKKDIVITWAIGHLLMEYEPGDYTENWKSWWNTPLPLVPKKFMRKPFKDKKQQYEHICKLLEDAVIVINAADVDREGQNLCDEITDGKTEEKINKRLFLNALDDESIQNALESMENNDKFKGLYYAGRTRQNIDWLIGINLTRYFTNSAHNGGIEGTVAVGRVKAPTVALIVKREKEIENFKPETYFNIFAYVSVNGKDFKAGYESTEKIKLDLDASKIVNNCSGKQFVVNNVKVETKKEKVNVLYSLNTLQIDADKTYGLSANKTLEILQHLYELKYTTYPRSDCQFLPESQRKDALEIASLMNEKLAVELGLIPCIAKNNPNLNNSPVFNDKKITAHHAIIPTKVVPILSSLSEDEKKIYLLIAKKYAGIFMNPYTYEKTEVIGRIEGYPFKFICKNIIDPGYTIYYPERTEKDKETPSISGKLSPGERLNVSKVEKKEERTQPPKRYTEGTLIAAMANIKSENEELNETLTEIKGIGTPATRANIIETIIKVDKHVLKKGKSLYPTEKGKQLVKFLPKILTEADYTAEMELELKELEEGKKTEQELIDKTIKFVTGIVESNIQIINKDFPCPKCHTGYLFFKRFKNKDTGAFDEKYICNNDSCKISFPSIKGKPKIVKCPNCKKGFMLKKRGKYGDFYGCSEYANGCKKIMKEEEFLKSKK